MIREDKQFDRKVQRFLFATATAFGNQLCAATGTARKEVAGAYSKCRIESSNRGASTSCVKS
jgi:hypothetical protein